MRKIVRASEIAVALPRSSIQAAMPMKRLRICLGSIVILGCAIAIYLGTRNDIRTPTLPTVTVTLGTHVVYDDVQLTDEQAKVFGKIVQGSPADYLDKERSDPPIGFFQSGSWSFGLYPGQVVGYNGDARPFPVWKSRQFAEMIEVMAANGYRQSPSSTTEALLTLRAP